MRSKSIGFSASRHLYLLLFPYLTRLLPVPGEEKRWVKLKEPRLATYSYLGGADLSLALDEWPPNPTQKYLKFPHAHQTAGEKVVGVLLRTVVRC
jgi:hypothetical protein